MFGMFSATQLYKVGYYELNQDRITLEHCVNKNNPEMKCHGQCHLRKELGVNVSVDITTHRSHQTFNSSLMAFHFSEMPAHLVPSAEYGVGITIEEKSSLLHDEYYGDIFKPPC